MAASLFLIPTVLADDTQHKVISPQVKEVIAHTTVYLVENERTARRYISSLQLGIAIETLELQLLHKDSKQQEIADWLKKYAGTHTNIGLMSEAGCPGIADPGAMAVALAHQLGMQVIPLAGPSSIFMALMASGFSGQNFCFKGYLPIDKAARNKELQQMLRQAQAGQSQIFMETPFRNNQLLDDLCLQLPAQQKLCIAANITASDEYICTKIIADWKLNKPNLHKKPTIFIIG